MIYLWTAGSATGTSGSAEAAFRRAVPYLAAGVEAVVEEAVVEMLPTGTAGSLPEYRRTGNEWRGRLEDGALSWERPGTPSPEAVAADMPVTGALPESYA